MTSHSHDLAAKTVLKWRPAKSLLSRQYFFRTAGTSEDETLERGITECLLAIGKDQKVTFLE